MPPTQKKSDGTPGDGIQILTATYGNRNDKASMAADCDGRTSCTWGAKHSLDTYGDPQQGIAKTSSYSWTCRGATQTKTQAAEASNAANFEISCPC